MQLRNYQARLLFSVLLIVFLVFGVSIAVAAERTRPTTAQEQVIKDAAKFLDEMGMKNWGDNVRKWLADGKIFVNSNMQADGSTNRKGEITVKKDFVNPLPHGELESFKRLADLASLLIHEKVHAHQAPEGGSLADNVEPGDWTAGADVHDECVGPDPLEVDAHYKQILAYYLWVKKIQSKVISDDLTDEQREKEEMIKKQKIEWLLKEAERWADILKRLNYEKYVILEIKSLADLLKEIDDNKDIADNEKLDKKIELLEKLIENLFVENGFYQQARNRYQEKQGQNAQKASIIPGTQGVVHLPGDKGTIILNVPEDILLYQSDMLEISIFDFMIPPLPDPGYKFISPVFDINWNALEPVPMTINIYIEGNYEWDDVKVSAFAMEKDKSLGNWTKLADTIVELIDESLAIVSTASDAATMYAVQIPSPTFIDLKGNHWAYDSVERMVSKGIVDHGELFLPTMIVSREVFVKYLVRGLGLPLLEAPLPFTDVSYSSPYYPYISTAYQLGLTQGVSSTSFGFGQALTREQSITFMIRSRDLEESALNMSANDLSLYLDEFVDKDRGISKWAHPYIALAVKIGLVEGYPDNSMRGTTQLNHAEVVTLVDRINHSMNSFFDIFYTVRNP